MRRTLVTFIGSFCYTGFFPIAPASFASFVWVLCFLFLPGGRFLVNPLLLIVTIPFSIYIAGIMERYYGHDAPEIVIDEFVGMQLSLLMFDPSPGTAAAGFMLFRIYDIAKPFPVGRSQRIPGGAGVVIDDVIAGIYSFVTLKFGIFLISLLRGAT